MIRGTSRDFDLARRETVHTRDWQLSYPALHADELGLRRLDRCSRAAVDGLAPA